MITYISEYYQNGILYFNSKPHHTWRALFTWTLCCHRKWYLLSTGAWVDYISRVMGLQHSTWTMVTLLRQAFQSIIIPRWLFIYFKLPPSNDNFGYAQQTSSPAHSEQFVTMPVLNIMIAKNYFLWHDSSE